MAKGAYEARAGSAAVEPGRAQGAPGARARGRRLPGRLGFGRSANEPDALDVAPFVSGQAALVFSVAASGLALAAIPANTSLAAVARIGDPPF